MAAHQIKQDPTKTPLNVALLPNQHASSLHQQPHSLGVSTSGLSTSGANSRGLVQVYVPSQQLIMMDGDKSAASSDKSVRSTCLTNSSRWSDAETRHLVEVWGTRYLALKNKKRNFREWEQIAREFNKRCISDGVSALGPRTGAQCKIRIKNIIADYKRAKGEYNGIVSRQLTNYFDMVSEILSKKSTDSIPQDNEFEEFDGGEDVRADEIVHLPLSSEVIETQDVSMATMAASMQTSSNSLPVPVAVQSLAMSTQSNLVQGSTRMVTTIPCSTNNTHNHINLACSSIPIAPAVAVGPVHVAPQGQEPQCEEIGESRSSDDSSPGACADSLLQVPRQASNKPINIHNKQIRKNPRPLKVVKITRGNEGDRLLTIVRGFMEENRRREEELFDKLFQQQAQAEKRYQEFTLNVIREIGKMFRPGASD
ncbi:uncharacterized protein LOC116618507 [Nematostella vectensis]|uniref:uncharacterized protein LOC116618507 n=1 Tax=Nematostella vectensis TaxID=45351 RepID=UPI0020773496|nr:uncharacterized protein LOC116618507 [Nematostella vectensis]